MKNPTQPYVDFVVYLKTNINSCVDKKKKRSTGFQSSIISLIMVGYFLGKTKMKKNWECQRNGFLKQSKTFSRTANNEVFNAQVFIWTHKMGWNISTTILCPMFPCLAYLPPHRFHLPTCHCHPTTFFSPIPVLVGAQGTQFACFCQYSPSKQHSLCLPSCKEVLLTKSTLRNYELCLKDGAPTLVSVSMDLVLFYANEIPRRWLCLLLWGPLKQ